MAAGNQSFQKQANIALILKMIHDFGLVSRVELSRSIGLRKSTITNIVNELLDIGIVLQKETGCAGASGGRKPVLLSINPGMGCILGLEPRPGSCDAVLYDLNGDLIWEKKLKTKDSLFSDMFIALYEELSEEILRDGLNLLAVAVGVSGIVDTENGIIKRSITYELNNFDYRTNICARIPVPVFFENDTNCAAWGELKNPENNSRNFICLLSKLNLPDIQPEQLPGIGLGFVIRGEIYRGADFSSGEFGTNNWFTPGTEYTGISRNEWDRLNSDEQRVKVLMTAIFRMISVSLSLLNPEELILAGDMKNFRILLPEILKELKDDSWFGNEDNTRRIRFSRRESMEIAGGAANMVLSRLYSIPQLGEKEDEALLGWTEVFSRINRDSNLLLNNKSL